MGAARAAHPCRTGRRYRHGTRRSTHLLGGGRTHRAARAPDRDRAGRGFARGVLRACRGARSGDALPARRRAYAARATDLHRKRSAPAMKLFLALLALWLILNESFA